MEKTNNEDISISKKMSIQVSLGGFSFCALDKHQGEIQFFHQEAFQERLNPVEVLQRIERLYFREAFLQKEQSIEVEVLFSNELYTLVPRQYYTEENASDFLKFNTKMLQTDVISQDLVAEDLVNVYIPYTNIVNFFFDKYGEFQYRHSLSVLIEALLEESKEDPEICFYVHRHDWGFDLIVIEHQKLLMANTFQCQTKEDFLYYLLFSAEQLGQDPEKFNLMMFGDITEDSEFYHIAYSYIRHIQVLERSFGYSYTGKGNPPSSRHHYALLTSLHGSGMEIKN